ncbi:MAG: YceI family protein [bacterium]
MIKSISAQTIVTEASISFTFKSKDVSGTIGDFRSNSVIDLQQFENSTLEGSVGVTTLETDNGLRDGHLMWKKYFHRKAHPRISFKSTSITKSGEKSFQITGNLTIKGITKSITFDGKLTGSELEISGELNSTDFDIRIKKESENNLVSIEMKFKL